MNRTQHPDNRVLHGKRLRGSISHLASQEGHEAPLVEPSDSAFATALSYLETVLCRFGNVLTWGSSCGSGAEFMRIVRIPFQTSLISFAILRKCG